MIKKEYYLSLLNMLKNAFLSNTLGHNIMFKNIDNINPDMFLYQICSIFLKKQVDNFDTASDIFYLQSFQEQIKIDSIKKLIHKISLSCHHTEVKIVIIYPIESLNRHAGNLLLKVLEEPPKNTYFLLVCNNAKQVLPTILSRMQLFNLKLTTKEKHQYLRETYQMDDTKISKAMHLTKNSLYMIQNIKKDKIF